MNHSFKPSINWTLGVLILLLTWSCNVPDPIQKLKNDLEVKIKESPATIAIAFQDIIDTNRVILINAHEEFHAASTMKTPVMIEVFKQVNKGKLSLRDSILVKNEFYSIVDSSIYQMDIGEDSESRLYNLVGQKRELEEMVSDMITHSSNLATNIVIDLVDAKKVTQTMRDLGAPDINVLRGVEDIKAYEQGLSNSTTAYDLMVMFTKMGQKRVVSSDACNKMIEILLNQHFNDQIPALLPKSVKVAHKTGWISSATHDSGIVFLEDGRSYSLVILTKNWKSDKENRKLMAELSKMIYDAYISWPTSL